MVFPTASNSTTSSSTVSHQKKNDEGSCTLKHGDFFTGATKLSLLTWKLSLWRGNTQPCNIQVIVMQQENVHVVWRFQVYFIHHVMCKHFTCCMVWCFHLITKHVRVHPPWLLYWNPSCPHWRWSPEPPPLRDSFFRTFPDSLTSLPWAHVVPSVPHPSPTSSVSLSSLTISVSLRVSQWLTTHVPRDVTHFP